ncbi:MAG: HNH endonuclease [Acidimicrobiales bacterium]
MAPDPADPSFGDIAERIWSIPIDQLTAAELHELVTGLRRVQWAADSLLVRIGDGFDRAAAAGEGPGAIDGLAGDGQVSGRRARVEAARTALARDLDGLSEALEGGRIGGEHVDVLVSANRRLIPAEREQLSARSSALVAAAADRSVDAFGRLVDAVVDEIRRARTGAGTADDDELEAASSVRWWRDRLGMGHIHARLDPLRYESVIQAIENAKRSLQSPKDAHDHEAPFDSRLAAEAFVQLVCQTTLGRSRPSLIVVVKPDGSAETSAGTPVGPDQLDLLGCDASTQAVLLGADGLPLRVGRARRTATDAQWAALQALYRSCAWHQCEQPLRRCQAHHVRWWENNGRTDIENLVPLCRRHHRLVHRAGWRLNLTADRELRIHQPDGELWRTSIPDRLTDAAPVSPPAGTSAHPGSSAADTNEPSDDASPSEGSGTSVTRPP